MKIHKGCTPRMRRAIEALPRANEMLKTLKVAYDVKPGDSPGLMFGTSRYCQHCDDWQELNILGICQACSSPVIRHAL